MALMRSPNLRVAHQTHAHDLGDRLPGDVVLGRPESAAEDHGVAAIESQPDTGDHALEVVADLGLEVGVDTGQRQVLTHPGGVRVHNLTEQQTRCQWR